MTRCPGWQEFIRQKSAQFDGELKRQRPVQMKDIGRKGRHRFIREAWTFIQQHNFSEKVFVIERLRKIRYEDRLARRSVFREWDVEYRIGYYVVGRIGKMRGRWAWVNSARSSEVRRRRDLWRAWCAGARRRGAAVVR
jgi:hypothetical protein